MSPAGRGKKKTQRGRDFFCEARKNIPLVDHRTVIRSKQALGRVLNMSHR